MSCPDCRDAEGCGINVSGVEAGVEVRIKGNTQETNMKETGEEDGG